jgi:3-oxoacyl-[acyl-carrier protein] reductase
MARLDGRVAPMGRFGRPEEVAELVSWNASDAGPHCTGSDFVIDGGDLAATALTPPHEPAR